MNDPDGVDRDAIKARFIAERGYWRPWTEAILREDPLFLERYARYAGHPARSGPLPERMVELIYVALDASATHLFAGGLRTHLIRAFEVGVRPKEVFDVLQLVAEQGLDRVFESANVLAMACNERRITPSAQTRSTTAQDDHLPDRVRRSADRAGLDISEAALDLILRIDPGYIPVVIEFLDGATDDAGLPECDKALIEVALRACFTGFDALALRSRIDRALDLGRTPAELLQAIQLGAHLSVHGTALGATTLAELGKA